MRVISQIQQSVGASTTHHEHVNKITQVYCWSKEHYYYTVFDNHIKRCFMKNRVSRRLVSLLMCVTLILGYATIANASSYYSTTSTSNGSKMANTVTQETVHTGSHTYRIQLQGVSFYGGQPANTFPSGGSVTIYIENTGVSRTYYSLDKQNKTGTYSVSSDVTAYSAISASAGVTVYYYWDPNY